MVNKPDQTPRILATMTALLERSGNIEDAFDVTFTAVSKLMQVGAFDDFDNLMREVDIEETSTTTLIAIASATKGWSDHLPSRGAFFERVLARLARTNVTPEMMEQIR